MALQKKGASSKSDFSFRVKIGECEVELNGTREEVLETVENLPNLVANVHKAFECAKPKAIATITVKTTEETKPATKPAEPSAQNYPKIVTTEDANQAVLRILESDWGKWRPRTEEELKQAMQTNKINFTDRVLASALDGLSKKGLVRRWDTNTGFVYILAEKTMKPKGER
jgi:hypothetical protein